MDEAKDYTSSTGAQVSGFGSGDDIDFRAVGFTSGVTTVTWTQNGASGTLTATSGSTSASVALVGDYTGGQTVSVNSGVTSVGLIVASAGPQFASASDGSGGTDVTFSPVVSGVTVSSGGVISNTIVSGGLAQVVIIGGTAIGTTLKGGHELLSSGATASNTVVSAGGGQTLRGGTTVNTVVSSGGEQDVSVGVASGTTVLNGGKVLVDRLGTITGALLSSGASATIEDPTSHGHIGASGTTVLSGGTQVVAVSGIASGTVLNGGIEILSGGGAATAEEQLALVNSGGLELVSTTGLLDSATISGGTVEIATGGQLSGTASFATSGGGTLQLDEAKDYGSGGAVVSGFTSGDFIDFQAIAFSGSILSWNQINTSSGTLSVSNGGTSASITLLGQYVAGVGGSFTSASDGNGGTRVGDPPVVAQADLLANPHST